MPISAECRGPSALRPPSVVAVSAVPTRIEKQLLLQVQVQVPLLSQFGSSVVR